MPNTRDTENSRIRASIQRIYSSCINWASLECSILEFPRFLDFEEIANANSILICLWNPHFPTETDAKIKRNSKLPKCFIGKIEEPVEELFLCILSQVKIDKNFCSMKRTANHRNKFNSTISFIWIFNIKLRIAIATRSFYSINPIVVL